jgi:hypothetical protein
VVQSGIVNQLQLFADTVPFCMEEMVAHNTGVVLSPIHLYVTCNAGLVSTSENVTQVRKHYLLVIWNSSRELITPFFAIIPCPYVYPPLADCLIHPI